MDELSTLAIKYGTDKGPQGANHGYTVHYHGLMSPWRNEVRSVLEIGVYQGASIRMWREYFPHATIYGLDHAAEVAPSLLQSMNVLERVRVLVGDERNAHDLDWVVAAGAPFDVVIDDASHSPADYLPAFRHLWKHTTRIYVIEDIFEQFIDQTMAATVLSLDYGPSIKWYVKIQSRTPPGTSIALVMGR